MKLKYIVIILLVLTLCLLAYFILKPEENLAQEEKKIEYDENNSSIATEEPSIENEPKNFTDLELKEDIGEFISHKYYDLSYSEEHEQAYWVRYTLTRNMLENPIAKRKDNFRTDPLISSGSAELIDYRGSGFDRGHLCPAKDMAFSEIAMSESFFMSNMSPQHPSLNRGRWKQLEDQVRKWTMQHDSVVVYCGGILDSLDGFIGPNNVAVPKYFYKIIYTPNNETKSISFMMPNRKCEYKLPYYTVSIDSLESLTHIDFFNDLPLSIQEEFESNTNFMSWFE